MRRSPRLFRLTAGVALAALVWDTALPWAAVAQPALPPLPPDASAQQPTQEQSDPPERVGRIAAITGVVSFRTRNDTQWSPASLNYPVSTGDSFWTEPTATSSLEVSASRISLAGATELTVVALDASGMQTIAAQGEAWFHLRDLAPDENWVVQTPRGTVRLSGQGHYDIVVGTADRPTLVTVIDGSAQIEAPGVLLQVQANQTATLTGTNPFQGSVGPVIRTPFLTARLDAERPPPIAAVMPRQVVAMPGGEDLAAVGSWNSVPEYGPVWYPPVAPNWVPYRQGHWAYVAPWGWTWVDDAPWGFAPFHYGRWVEIDGRWAWTPGLAPTPAPPVYAPALVTFIGIGAGVVLGAALASGSVGWIPLGPREAYHPWYHASPAYVRQVNVSHVTNITTINNTVTINNFVNRAAATSVPATAMTQSRPVQTVARPFTPQDFSAARPIVGQQPIRPASTTAGVTPAVARQLHLGPVPLHPAPGPVPSGPPPANRATAGAQPPLPGRPYGPAPRQGAQAPAMVTSPGQAGVPSVPSHEAQMPAAHAPGQPGLPPHQLGAPATSHAPSPVTTPPAQPRMSGPAPAIPAHPTMPEPARTPSEPVARPVPPPQPAARPAPPAVAVRPVPVAPPPQAMGHIAPPPQPHPGPAMPPHAEPPSRSAAAHDRRPEQR